MPAKKTKNIGKKKSKINKNSNIAADKQKDNHIKANDETIPSGDSKDILKEQEKFLDKKKKEEEDKQKKKEALEKDITKTIRKKKKEKTIKKSAAERKRWLQAHIEKAGFEIPLEKVTQTILRFSIGLGLAFMVFYFIGVSLGDASFIKKISISVINGIVIFGVSWIILQIGFWSFIDYTKFKRKLMIEAVLPDFYQLASANIRAGMPIDRALWFAVRPRFGVLAKEIEVVAKRTLSGDDLHDALIDFANRYDSKLVLRSVYLLNEGIKAGGNVGDLLNKISINLQEMKTMKKEMAANVTTYVIFITFAAIVAGPILFGLSDQLLSIVQSIASNVAQTTDGGMATKGAGISLNMSGDSIKQSDFRIFVYTCLFFSSLFSAMIISTIQKGNAKEGLQNIPIFIIIAYTLFYISAWGLGIMFSGLI